MNKNKTQKINFSFSNLLSQPLVKRFFAYVFIVEEPVDRKRFIFEAIGFALLSLWSIGLLKLPASGEASTMGWVYAFLDRVNLIFHEAGHIFLMWAGKFLHAFGGTLFQCLVPLVAMGAFLRQKDNFSAGLMLWWFGQNLIDVATYIYDAWDRTALLLGGVTGQSHPEVHDWYVLLNLMGSLENYSVIASTVSNFGKFFILLSLIWAGKVLYKKKLILKHSV
ncbi:MAG: hypothetical protein OXC37_02695 [Bdellovibrionaceae bacterium]|nr:hypothetical protein [Pseudobdellovibrionaceae bacterium]